MVPFDRPAAARVELRSSSVAGTTIGASGTGRPARSAMISSTARATTSAIGCTTAVSGGCVKRTIGVSSKLTSDRSRGTSMPRSRPASSVASAIWSLLAMIAVGGAAPSNNRVAARLPEA